MMMMMMMMMMMTQYWSENHQMGWITGQYLLGAAMEERPELRDIILRWVVLK